MARFDLARFQSLQKQLNEHPIYHSLDCLEDLRIFMTHHVFSVWDFMSLVKYLQGKIAPVQIPWVPAGNRALRHFINQLTAEEESDTAPGPGDEVRYGSHFEFYREAMGEIGADGQMPTRFVALVQEKGVDAALYSDMVPLPARYFSETTFGLIRGNKPHEVAAALALGRERVIPEMFGRFLKEMNISERDAPGFHYYLRRHIHLDADIHGPLSLALLDELCAGDPDKIDEAETAAEEALCARIRFWDGVLEAIETSRAAR
jgi:hypothetical protein